MTTILVVDDNVLDRKLIGHSAEAAGWSVEFAECLASCGTAPVCLVNDDFHEAVSADKAEELLAKYPE